eukprot:jgi/Mesen1/9430/ME000618S08824
MSQEQELRAEGVDKLASEKLLLAELERQLAQRLHATCDGTGLADFGSMADFLATADAMRDVPCQQPPLRSPVQSAPATWQHGPPPGSQLGGGFSEGQENGCQLAVSDRLADHGNGRHQPATWQQAIHDSTATPGDAQ